MYESLCETAVDNLDRLDAESQRVVSFAVGEILYKEREEADIKLMAYVIKERLRRCHVIESAY